MDYNGSGSGDRIVYDSSGNAQASVDGTGVTLGIATYYIPFGSTHSSSPAQTSVIGIHMKWSAALAATITVETCNFPRSLGGSTMGSATDVSDYDSTAGNWIQFNPAITTPAMAYANAAGSGNSVTALAITAGGSAAGGAFITINGFPARRGRLKVVTTVGGVLRTCVIGKVGG